MKNRIYNHIKKYKIQYGSAFILLFLIAGVSFKKILDPNTRKRKEKIEYIIIHYTANLHPKASAHNNAKYLQKAKNAGCNWAIDDIETIECVPEDRVAYAVGDRKWLGFIPKPWHKGKIFNENSLSYEMCLGGGRNDSLITDLTAKYVAFQLLNKGFIRYDEVQVWDGVQHKNIKKLIKVPDLGRVVRHHDVTGKQCPKFYYNEPWNQQKEDRAFYKFKLLVNIYFQQYELRKNVK